MRVLYAGDPQERQAWGEALRGLRPDLSLDLDPAACDPASVEVLLWEADGPVRDLTPYAGLRLIQNLWAGVEAALANPTLPEGVPLARMVEDGLVLGMRDYVTGHVLRAHLGVERQRAAQRERDWRIHHPPLARDRTVGLVGLGELGADCAATLAGLGFKVLGWSRSAKAIEGVTSLTGEAGFDRLLRESTILVLLAPLTDGTRGLMDAGAFARMQPGSHLVNAARGPLVVDEALLEALGSGRIETATLDVFHEEPLPPDHPYWTTPGVLVTPHVASLTRPSTAAVTVVEQIGRLERGEAPAHIVQRDKGY